jgi:pimeloyl-ACP methyl ester carboxylesterase
MSISYLPRDTGRIGYDVTGAGPLVLCLPGMGDLRSVYRFAVPELVSAGFRVATMDLRGHGDSDDSFDEFDDVAAGRDALALIEHLGGPAVVIGNSMSAGAAVWAAAESPGSVAGLVLMGPFVRDPRQSALSTLAFRLALMRPWGPSVWLSYYASLYPGRPPADLAEHRGRIRASLRTGRHWQSFVRTTRTSHAPAQARLANVSAPTLVVMGTKDKDWPDPEAEARFVAESLRAELLLVPGGGHYPMAEYPDVVMPPVVDFARRANARG